jgi:integral membrane sensor domain MASE1
MDRKNNKIHRYGYGHFLSFPGEAFATFWPPGGLLLGTLLLTERRAWPRLILATVPAVFAAEEFLSRSTQRSMVLMSDPVAAYSYTQALWVGRALECTAGAPVRPPAREAVAPPSTDG